jgi:flavin reductase (DIM6/NTAB) family NADH-FMN oxidoreductase RutF
MVPAVDRLALTTGSDPVPDYKARRGYHHVRDKFDLAGLTPVASELVAPPRVAECPVQLEATLVAHHDVASDDDARRGALVALEVRVRRVHVAESILAEGESNRIEPDRWRPLIMSFQHFYGLTTRRLHPSRLASIPERMYRAS